MDDKKNQKLVIYTNKSVLTYEGIEEEFKEGPQSPQAKVRYQSIRKKLKDGYFETIIDEVIDNPNFTVDLGDEDAKTLDVLVNSITSEVGRAVAGLCIMQLLVKSIAPEQSIRLHKGGTRQSSFSWQEGISMRAIDSNFITPVLRKYDFIKLNRDGIMMTRSLAENYPYSRLYKAAIKGDKQAWTYVIDKVEKNELDPLSALKYLISKLSKQTNSFLELVDESLVLLKEKSRHFSSKHDTVSFFQKVLSKSTYSARLFEVFLHSFFQVINSHQLLDGNLKPLSQMRSANKKHKNVGDIEVVSPANSRLVFQAWDAKFGKPYLRDEIDELEDKLEIQPEIEEAGFVVNEKPRLDEDILIRLNELSDMSGIQIRILTFEEWVDFLIKKYDLGDIEDMIYKEWASAVIESLGQKRRELAPIDEPCTNWIHEITYELKHL